MARAWTVRGGWDGQREELALTEGLAIAGWSRVRQDLAQATTIDELRNLLMTCYRNEHDRAIENWTHQLWRFVHEMQIGDLVVMPRKYRSVVAIGTISGCYEYRENAEPGCRHVRLVEWLSPTIERAAISGDLRASMGAYLTISELSRRNAVERIKALSQTGIDPGYSGGLTPPATVEELRQDVLNSGPRQLSVRDLIRLWGHERRTGDVLDDVSNALNDLDLAVEPDFAAVQLDSIVTVLPVNNSQPALDDGHTESEGGAASLSMTVAARDLTWRIGNLRQNGNPVTLTASDSLERAIEVMVTGGFSQIPIVDKRRRLQGVVTWESIAHSSLTRRNITLWDARADAYPPAAHGEEELFARIDDIQRFGFVIVVDAENVVTGIVTAADLAGELKTRIMPFTVLEEVERRLRRALGHLSMEDLRSGLKNGKEKVKSTKDLTLGNYPFVVNKEEVWKKLGWPFERGPLVERLKSVARYRNEIAHWNVDAPDSADNQLRDANELLKLLKLVTRHPS